MDTSELERMRELARKLSRQMEEAKRKKEGTGSSHEKADAARPDSKRSDVRKNGDNAEDGPSSRHKERKKKKKKDASMIVLTSLITYYAVK